LPRPTAGRGRGVGVGVRTGARQLVAVESPVRAQWIRLQREGRPHCRLASIALTRPGLVRLAQLVALYADREL